MQICAFGGPGPLGAAVARREDPARRPKKRKHHSGAAEGVPEEGGPGEGGAGEGLHKPKRIKHAPGKGGPKEGGPGGGCAGEAARAPPSRKSLGRTRG